MSEPSNGVFRVILSPLQAHPFRELLDQAKGETGVEGLLLSVARHYDSASGGSVVELQAARLSRSATQKVQKIITEEQLKLEPAPR